MPFVFEEGEQVVSGAEGTNNYEFIEGTPLTDLGISTLVFVSGTGIGGSQITVNGTDVGFFETAESPAEFINFTESAQIGAQGLVDAGIIDDYQTSAGGDAHMWVHHSTTQDIWHIGFWSPPQSASITTHNGSAGVYNNPGNPELKEDEASGVEFTTDADGDALHNLITGGTEGDHVGYYFDPSTPATIEIVSQDDPNEPEGTPSDIDFDGPDEKVTVPYPVELGDLTITLAVG